VWSLCCKVSLTCSGYNSQKQEVSTTHSLTLSLSHSPNQFYDCNSDEMIGYKVAICRETDITRTDNNKKKKSVYCYYYHTVQPYNHSLTRSLAHYLCRPEMLRRITLQKVVNTGSDS
jgi:hypothetical protein